MKLIRMNIVFAVVILFGIMIPAIGQNQASKRPNDKAWTVGAKGSAIFTFGDIKYNDFLPNLKYGELGWGADLYFSKYLSSNFGLKAGFNYSRLYGTDVNNDLIQSFQTNLQSASLQFQFNIVQVFNSQPRLNKFSIWGDIGMGYIRWQSLLYNRNTLDTLDQIHWNSNKYMSAFMIPIGLNFRYYVHKKWSVDAQVSTTIVNSDWLDAKKEGNAYDSFLNFGLGLNYHFRIQKSIRKVPDTFKKEKGDISLLDYMNLDPFDDPEIKRISKKEQIEIREAEEQKLIEGGNPFNVEFWVPQEANNEKFQVLISIKKRGITGSGYFRLSLPSGFYPVQQSIDQVTYSRIGYNFDFDFYLPMNLDTLNIPIDIKVSEREEGTYPLLIEGEIMNSDGVLFPIKIAQYVKLNSGITYNQLPGENTKTLIKAELPDDDYLAPSNVSAELEESDGDKTYRIQILACRKPSQLVNDFLEKHQIDQKVYLWEKGGWWRYSIYSLGSMEVARKHLLLVRNKYGIKDAFIVEFNNGQRNVPDNQPSLSIKTYQEIDSKSQNNEMDESGKTFQRENYIQEKNQNQGILTQVKKSNSIKNQEEGPQFDKVPDYDNISVYRVEIAVSPASPIPLRQLQNWVAKEKITEWMYQDKYRYTIGRFENEQVARAFLRYVRMQFALPDAHLVETKGQNWLRVVR